MPTIKNGTIVNKTDFWRRNFNRRNGQFFAGKTVFVEFLELHFIFFYEILHTEVKWQYLKYEGERLSKNFFPVENAGNIPEKLVFWHSLEISLFVFPDFLHKDAY